MNLVMDSTIDTFHADYSSAASSQTMQNPKISLKFEFSKASKIDIPDILQLMRTVKEAMPQKEWFVDDNEDYLHYLLNGHGFILLAKAEATQRLAAFSMVKFPGLSEDNLGFHLGFSEKQLLQCVHMDSCVVHPDFRGQHLQSRMTILAEKQILSCLDTLKENQPLAHLDALYKQQITSSPHYYLLATVHPDNHYSLNSMKRCGYCVMKQTSLYGGLPRVIIMKEI